MRDSLYLLELKHLGCDRQFDAAVEAVAEDCADRRKKPDARRTIRIDIEIVPEPDGSRCAHVTSKVTYKLAPPALDESSDRFFLHPLPALASLVATRRGQSEAREDVQ